MTDQNTFMEVVRNVAEIVRTAEVPMSESEILAYFSDMDLDENQKRIVLAYIETAQSEETEEGQQEDTTGADEEEQEGRSKVFQMYLDELSLLPSFTAKDREKLYERLSSGDETVVETISTAWLKKVLTLAEKYMQPRLHLEDLVQEGNMALFLCLQDMLGKPYNEQIEEVLSAAVEEGIMNYCSEIVGESELENTLVGKISLVHEAKKMLSLEKGQAPTIEELSEYTKMSIDELSELEEYLKQ